MSDVMAPAEAFPVGEYLRDELAERGWSETEFAQIIGRPIQAVSEILNGKKEITTETADAIGDALGTSAELWLGLQTAYRLYVIRRDKPLLSPVARRARLRTLVPVRELQKRGWLLETKDVDELEASVCELLCMSDPSETPQLVAAARRSNSEVKEFTPQQIAWISRVRQLGCDRDTKPLDLGRLADLGATLAGRLRSPHDLALIDGWLMECGVSLVVELPLKGSKIDGVVIFSEAGKPIIGLSTRGDRMDSVIFTLLHEIAHLSLGHVRPGIVYLDEDLLDGVGSDVEEEANRQAADWILPRDFRIEQRRPTLPTIVAAAQGAGVHPSLVIGRLQREGVLDWSDYRASIPKVRSYLVGG